MAETAAQPGAAAPREDGANWAQVWHLPVLLLGTGLFLVGIYFAMPTPEKNDFPKALDEIAQYLKADNLEQAEQRLNKIQQHIEKAKPTSRARMWQYWGDLNYLQLHNKAPAAVTTDAGQQTNRQIISYYKKAEELERTLDPRAIRRYAQTLVALGRGDEALSMLDRLKDQPPRQRYLIIRKLIKRHRRAGGEAQIEKLTPLIERFKSVLREESEPAMRRKQATWVAGVEARLRLDAGAPQEAISLLLPRIQRLKARGAEHLAPLHVLLAKAYQRIGELQKAEARYRYAQQKVPSTEGLNADIHVGLGEIALARSDGMNVQRALEQFSRAARNFPSEDAYIDALMGQADCEARLDSHEKALEHFGLAVDRLREDASPTDPRRAELTDIVRNHIQRAYQSQDYSRALDYLSTLKPLHRPDLPPELLRDLARTHERIAQRHQQRVKRAAKKARRAGRSASGGSDQRADANGTDAELMSREARRLANQEAATHFARAGAFYRRHAEAVTITDNEAHGQSLWKAATSFDQAQRWKEAIKVYEQFIQTRKTDSRHVRAINRLGKAYLADGQYEAAAELLLDLLDEHPHTLEAYDSLVPLARAYLGMGETDKAERTLLKVVTDHEGITPQSEQYRAALIELGQLYYRLGDERGSYYVDAFERLTEAVKRYGRSAEGPKLRYLLADAYRRSVKVLERKLDQGQGQSNRVSLQAEKQRRLKEAQKYYNQVLTELQARPENSLTPLQKLYLRNSFFYQADCAFDRGQYERAIELYDLAARRHKRHPASLVALVQIVNAHCELGQFQEAKVANERARRQLQRIPEDAFQDQTVLPMSRQHWEDWLRWTSEVDLFDEGALQEQAQARR